MLGQKSFIQPSVYYKVQVGSCILLELYEAKNELPLFMKFFCIAYVKNVQKVCPFRINNTTDFFLNLQCEGQTCVKQNTNLVLR